MNTINNEEVSKQVSKAIEERLDGRIKNASLNGKKRPLSKKSKEVAKKLESLANELKQMHIPCFLMAFNEDAYENPEGHEKTPEDSSFFYECYTTIETGAYEDELIPLPDVLITEFLSVIMKAKDTSDYSVNLEDISEEE